MEHTVFRKIKENKGSITLFVLVTMLFLIMVLLLAYTAMINKKQDQEKQVAKIKAEYEVSAEALENTYNEVKNKVISVEVNFQNDGKTYHIAKGGKVQIETQINLIAESGTKIQEAKYGWSNSNSTPPAIYQDIEGETVKATKEDCTKGEYYLWVTIKDNKGKRRNVQSKAFKVEESDITLTKSTDQYTKDPITVTINYGEGLTKNRQIGLGKTEEEAKNMLQANENLSIIITENSYICIKVEDQHGNEMEKLELIDNFDMQKPSIQLIPNGGEYILRDETTKEISVQVTTEDKQSGVKNIKAAWSSSNTQKPEESEYQEIQNGETITKQAEEGKYYLWIKAEDRVGNIAEEPSYEYVVRPPIAPEVMLKENDSNGQEYTSGTWTNQNVYTQITLPESEGTVEKYEISLDGENWYDIGEQGVKTTIDYETTFPLSSENKPSWMGELTNGNDNYYFVQDGATIKSNNKGVSSSVAHSYIPIDLTAFSAEENLTITINATVNSENNYDWGYATITNTTAAPSYNSSTGRFFYKSGPLSTADYTTTIKGGVQYYLHFGYRKDSSSNTGDDQCVINSLKITSETIGINMDFEDYTKTGNTIEYKLTKEMKRETRVRALYDDGSYSPVTEAFIVAIDKTAPVANINYDFISLEQANIIISDIKETASGLHGYYISTEETEPTKESNWIETTESTITIENLNPNNYYIWLMDKANNISNKMKVEIETPNYRIDNDQYATTLEKAIERAENNSTIYLLKDFEDVSTATINKNIILDVQEYTLTRSATITVNSGKTVEIIGKGTITNATNTTITNSGNLTINMEGRIENTTTSNSYRTIYTTGGTVTVNKGTVSGGYYGIYASNYFYPIIINGGTIQSTNDTNGYAIYNGAITINGGTIQGYNGIYGYGNITMENGKILAKNDGIEARYASSQVIIKGGSIEANYGIYQNTNEMIKIIGGKVEGSTYGIFGNYTEKIIIGDVDSEVNNNTPIVSGGTYGMYMGNNSNSFYFYNGIIMGMNTTPYTETIRPRDGYMVYTYYDYNNYRKYCSVLTQNVDQITIEQKPTEWTNQDVEVLVKYPVLDNTTLQFSEDGENWKDVSNGYVTNITENKTVYARISDASGILLESAEHEITNIDKIAPEVKINPEKTKYVIYNQEADSVDISLNVTLSDEGGSGIKTSEYGWSNSKDEEPTNWINLQNGDTITKEKCEVGTYYLWFKVLDNAGNTSETEVIKYIVELQEAVAKRGDTYYYTIQDAIDDSEKTTEVIEIIKDTNEESIVPEGKDITIDLQGHVVGSASNTKAVMANNGTLTIIDTSEGKTGTIENLVGTAIENNGTLTIGDNSSEIDDNTPTIKGKKTGIKNNNILNYYDGTIIGKSAIDGNVQGLPESYGPVSSFENGMSIINLRIISGYVARIDWFYYSTLQSAIDSCEAKEINNNKTTIHLLQDIVLENGSNVYNGQNIALDLNSHTLTSTNNSVITNYGILEITDFSENKTGTIMSSVVGGTSSNPYYKLINNLKELVVSEGVITTDKVGNYAIYNEDGTVNMEGRFSKE